MASCRNGDFMDEHLVERGRRERPWIIHLGGEERTGTWTRDPALGTVPAV